jgi:hypothetical protein
VTLVTGWGFLPENLRVYKKRVKWRLIFGGVLWQLVLTVLDNSDEAGEGASGSIATVPSLTASTVTADRACCSS